MWHYWIHPTKRNYCRRYNVGDMLYYNQELNKTMLDCGLVEVSFLRYVLYNVRNSR